MTNINRISTGVSRETDRVGVTWAIEAVDSPLPGTDQGFRIVEMDTASAEITAEQLLDALVDAEDDDELDFKLDGIPHTIDVGAAKQIVLWLLRGGVNSNTTNNFMDFITSELNLTEDQRHELLMRFRKYDSRMAEDRYEQP